MEIKNPKSESKDLIALLYLCLILSDWVRVNNLLPIKIFTLLLPHVFVFVFVFPFVFVSKFSVVGLVSESKFFVGN